MTEPEPSLSVLVISWNCWSDLRLCLDSVYASDVEDFEVIVVENASTDGTPELLPREFPAARVILNETNLGHSGGFNQGVLHARGRWILRLSYLPTWRDRAFWLQAAGAAALLAFALWIVRRPQEANPSENPTAAD